MDKRVFREGVRAFVFAAMATHAIACAGGTNQESPEDASDGGTRYYGDGGAKPEAGPLNGAHDAGTPLPPSGGADASTPGFSDAGPPPNPPDDDAGAPPSCTTNTDCGHFKPDASDVVEACLRPPGTCTGTGVCLPVAACGGDTDPVCGCDGVTYAGACAAFRAGVSVQKLEACGGTDPDAGR